MTPKYKILYTDGLWSLKMDSHPDRQEFSLKYWLSHKCYSGGQSRRDGKHTLTVNRFWDNTGRHCTYCGSVCPAGLQGMYLTLAVL